jgi:glutamine synthetase
MYCSGANANAPLLRQVAALLAKDTGLTPCLGAELEFYLTSQPEKLFSAIGAACKEAGIAASEVEKERGTRQYEMQLAPSSDPLLLAQHLTALRDIISNLAKEHGTTALFAAKPFPDEPGSAMHIHISLHDANGRNMLQKQGQEESPEMQYALGGLSRMLKASMPCFSPTEASYQRFVPHMEAPTTVSWGGNNRTTALRIPDSNPENRRIEHRVAAAESDPYLVIAAILAGIHYGITEHILPPARIYGNASDTQYGLEALPASLAEAEEVFKGDEVVRAYLGVADY